VRHRLREEHVRELARVRRRDRGVHAKREDRVERARDAVGVARELHARGVREKFALAGDRGLDRIRRDRAREADEGDQHPEHRPHRVGVAFLARHTLRLPGRAVDERLALLADPGEPGENPRQAHVERHVAVQDVAELVPHHALQLVARELDHRAARRHDHRLVRRVARYQRVHAVLAVERVHRRHRDARCDRHLLDHVEQAPLERVAPARIEVARAEQVRDRRAAVAELPYLPRGHCEDATADQSADRAGHLHRNAPKGLEVRPEKPVPLERRIPGERQPAAGVHREKRVAEHARNAKAGDDERYRSRIPQEQAARVAARARLLLEEIELRI
jgi:hypothetical protein